jgi:DNA-binding transcriptional LysR family regulator
VRLGEQVEKDMIAVRIAPDARMIVAAAPSCFETPARPVTPRELTHYPCINLRLLTYGGFYAWEFAKDGEEVRVRVDGQLAFNGVPQILAAALDGYGLAYLPEDVCTKPIAEGRLVQVLDDWCPRFPGYRLYYPSRRQPSPAFTLILDALRYRS